MKPKLLIFELWGIGDLAIATPFLRAAVEHYEVTLLAKPVALDLQPRFWSGVEVVPFNAPWTVFKNKYHVWRWPLREMFRLQQSLAARKFDFAFSSRWEPRDHPLMKILGVKERIGFPRLGSGIFLTQPLPRPEPQWHRYENWRAGAKVLGIEMPPHHQMAAPPLKPEKTILLHSGARLPARVWPLENWRQLAKHLREKNFDVQIACDVDQEDWWKQNGETGVACPHNLATLFSLVDRSRVFIGNCSGPGHVAAVSNTPTFTIFGPSMPEWFVPLHPQAEWIEGKACPYRPCSDDCRFSKPFCLHDLSEEEVRPRVEQFVQKHFNAATQ